MFLRWLDELIEGSWPTCRLKQELRASRQSRARTRATLRGVDSHETRRASPEVPVTPNAYTNSSSSAFASFRSGVSKPSVNQP
jgi:hypothetical protein